MKLTHDLIIFDLEATASKSPEGFQQHLNIIQLGAVYLKRQKNKTYSIADRFSRLVKPVGEEISPFITKLTGISNEMVKDAATWAVVGDEFEAWARKNGNIKRTKLCAWGTHFDMPILRKAYENEKKTYPFLGGGHDIKSWCTLWMMAKGRSEKVGLQEACEALSIPFNGQLHDAMADAEHTALIALKILEDLEHVLNSYWSGSESTAPYSSSPPEVGSARR